MMPNWAEQRLSSSSSGGDNEEDCICGPNSCRIDPKSSEDSSSDEEMEFVNVSLWENILRQSEEKLAPYEEWLRERKALEPVAPPLNGPTEFLEKEIFPLLLPAMRIMLMQAREWDALEIQKCRFNGLDFIAEVLWNRNPRYPERAQNWLELFSIPSFKIFLKSHPRPIFPKSWLWSREEGALIIQKWVRGWLVRKQEDVQEMRMFWKAIIAEMEEEAASLGITYSELVDKRREERAAQPCQRYKDLWLSKKMNLRL